ncbi:3-hydroxyacyl-CoA dehydrogenase family protein [Acrocarpospora catenulata]|uniref:3-hydroxyacyl-CoA dehydrogenase family protein n=1 Tax=Acrocarpospora catenulata TaxID=2836182 RepID=UPI001BD93178|nr:3-hydroxyacyl-CoA dehydrogenase family protein [Acrocarpospora catenulata]
MSEKFERVGIVGAGTMGGAIARFLSAAGVPVTAVETDLTALAGADLVVEAVPEKFDVKVAVLAEAAAVAGPGAVLATTTAALSVTELGAALPGPERFAGFVWHNPVDTTRTVEVVPGLCTAPETVARLAAFADSLPGKEALVVGDRPGFLLHGLLMPYLNDVVQAYDDGLAGAEDLDVAIELGLGYRTGPLAMLDRIGLDAHLDATEAAYAATGDRRYAPPPLLRRMVAAGRLGDKSGHGFRTQEDH